MTESDERSDSGAGWGGSAALSPWDALMWRAESDQRTSSAGMLLELLGSEPDWGRVLDAHRRTVDRIPRLRDRVVSPLLPLTQPVWSPDPDFELRRHVRRIRLGPGAGEREVLELCETIWTEPLDVRRPPWEGILVTGLEGGRAAYVFRCHHSLTDGTGLVQLIETATRSVDAPAVPALPRPAPDRVATSAAALTARGAVSWAKRFPGVLGAGGNAARSLAVDPTTTVDQALRYLRSAGRVLVPGAVGGSPLLSARGTQHRLMVLDVDLAALKVAGRASGGSLNDAYVAAVLGGFRRYHERHDVRVDVIPLAMPVSLRTAADPEGGNRFAGVRLAAPLAEVDPVERIRLVGELVRAVRTEPAISVMDRASTLVGLLPRPAIVELTARLTRASDLQVSNIRGLHGRVRLAGAEVTAMYPLGPRPGVAAMITLMTYAGRCCIGLNVDEQVFSDPEVLRDCLVEGFDEVLAIADPQDVAE